MGSIHRVRKKTHSPPRTNLTNLNAFLLLLAHIFRMIRFTRTRKIKKIFKIYLLRRSVDVIMTFRYKHNFIPHASALMTFSKGPDFSTIVRRLKAVKLKNKQTFDAHFYFLSAFELFASLVSL